MRITFILLLLTCVIFLTSCISPATDSSNEKDYITTIISASINENMPDFIFKLISYYNSELDGYEVQTITITDSSNNRVIQTIAMPEFTYSGQTLIPMSENETMGFELEDLNFDGYKDIRLYDTNNGNYLTEWIYFVWNPDKHLFENDKRLNEISLANFDQENQLVYGKERGSAADHWYYTYKYIQDVPTLIHLHSRNIIRDIEKYPAYLQAAGISANAEDAVGFHETVSKRNDMTGEMETISDEYIFHSNSDELNINEIIVRFDVSSRLGQMIATGKTDAIEKRNETKLEWKNALDDPILADYYKQDIEDVYNFTESKWIKISYCEFDLNSDGIADYIVLISSLIHGGSGGDTFDILIGNTDNGFADLSNYILRLTACDNEIYISDETRNGFHNIIAKYDDGIKFELAYINGEYKVIVARGKFAY